MFSRDSNRNTLSCSSCVEVHIVVSFARLFITLGSHSSAVGCATSRKFAGSIPDDVIEIFY
jgi:hypothetical protein